MALVDMYDALPPVRRAELRRKNKNRLAHLSAKSRERHSRLARTDWDGPTELRFPCEGARKRALYLARKFGW